MFRRTKKTDTPATGGTFESIDPVNETSEKTPDPAPLPPALAVDYRGWVYVWTRVPSASRPGSKVLKLTHRINPEGDDQGVYRTILGATAFADQIENAEKRSRALIDHTVDRQEAEQAAKRAETQRELDAIIEREIDALARAVDLVLNGPKDTGHVENQIPVDQTPDTPTDTSDTDPALADLSKLITNVNNAVPFDAEYTCDADPVDALKVSAESNGGICIGVDQDGSTNWAFLSADDALQVATDLADAVFHSWKVNGLPEGGARTPISNIPGNTFA